MRVAALRSHTPAVKAGRPAAAAARGLRGADASRTRVLPGCGCGTSAGFRRQLCNRPQRNESDFTLKQTDSEGMQPVTKFSKLKGRNGPLKIYTGEPSHASSVETGARLPSPHMLAPEPTH